MTEPRKLKPKAKKTQGVRIVPPKPERRKGWCIRWRDPDSGKDKETTIPELAARTAAGREAHAARKAAELARRKLELSHGAPKHTGTSIADALTVYFDGHPQLRPRTLEIYRNATSKLAAWAAAEGVGAASELTRARLLAFREHLVCLPKRAQAKGKRRGGRVATEERRSAAAINQDLRACGTVLRYLIDRDLLTRCTHDDLRRALKQERAEREAPEFLRPPQCRALLEAALRHDAATFVATRAEHAGKGDPGSTTRYDHPIAPLLVALLLGGFRVGEALGLRWADVDLTTTDPHGRVVGEIRLRGSATKTRHARVVGLDVSPGLRALLEAIRPKAAELAELPYVFGGAKPLPRTVIEAARKRLTGRAPKKLGQGTKRKRTALAADTFGAPAFDWQLLRSTCATVQSNAPSLFGAASAFLSAKRLGHSVIVAERRYAGQLQVPHDARTLEEAMGIGELVRAAVDAIEQ